MSGLVSMALRLAVVNLLKGRTAADDLVKDSPIDPVEFIVTKTADGWDVIDRPLIAVFVEQNTHEPRGREVGGTGRSINLVIWVYLPPTIVQVEDGFAFDARTEGAAVSLDIISAQIRRALLFGPAQWRKIFELIVPRIDRQISRPVLVEYEGGAKQVALETIITADSIPEPQLGKPMSGELWPAFYAAAQASPELSGFADLIKDMIESPDDISSWRQIQARIGVSYSDIRAMGLAPLDSTETEGEAAVLDQITVSGETVIGTPGQPGGAA